MRGRENHRRDVHAPISDELTEDLLLKQLDGETNSLKKIPFQKKQ